MNAKSAKKNRKIMRDNFHLVMERICKENLKNRIKFALSVLTKKDHYLGSKKYYGEK